MFSSELPFHGVDISDEFIETFPLPLGQFEGINLRVDNDQVDDFDVDQFIEYDHDRILPCQYNYVFPDRDLNSNYLQILFSNIRSFFKNFPYFTSSYFQSNNSVPTILALCETRI